MADEKATKKSDKTAKLGDFIDILESVGVKSSWTYEQAEPFIKYTTAPFLLTRREQKSAFNAHIKKLKKMEDLKTSDNNLDAKRGSAEQETQEKVAKNETQEEIRVTANEKIEGKVAKDEPDGKTKAVQMLTSEGVEVDSNCDKYILKNKEDAKKLEEESKKREEELKKLEDMKTANLKKIEARAARWGLVWECPSLSNCCKRKPMEHHFRALPYYIKRDMTLHGLWQTDHSQSFKSSTDVKSIPPLGCICQKRETKCHCRIMKERLEIIWPDFLKSTPRDAKASYRYPLAVWSEQWGKHGGKDISLADYIAKAYRYTDEYDMVRLLDDAGVKVKDEGYTAGELISKIGSVLTAQPKIEYMRFNVTNSNGIITTKTVLFRITVFFNSEGKPIDSLIAYPDSSIQPNSRVYFYDAERIRDILHVATSNPIPGYIVY